MERIPDWIERLLMPELNELAGKLKALLTCIDGVEKRVAVAKAVPTARSGVILPFLFIFGLYILPFPFSLLTGFYEISQTFLQKIKTREGETPSCSPIFYSLIPLNHREQNDGWKPSFL